MRYNRSYPDEGILSRLYSTLCFILLHILTIVNDGLSQLIEVFLPPAMFVSTNELLPHGLGEVIFEEVLETRVVKSSRGSLLGIGRHDVAFRRPGCL